MAQDLAEKRIRKAIKEASISLSDDKVSVLQPGYKMKLLLLFKFNRRLRIAIKKGSRNFVRITEILMQMNKLKLFELAVQYLEFNHGKGSLLPAQVDDIIEKFYKADVEKVMKLGYNDFEDHLEGAFEAIINILSLEIEKE